MRALFDIGIPSGGGVALDAPRLRRSAIYPAKIRAILADPAGLRMRSAKGYAKSPEAHYATMSAREIAALPVSHLASGNCLLWLWCTWPHLQQGLATMKSWGFTYKTGGAWTKTMPSGKRAFGPGYIFRTTTEPFLVGTIGEPAYRSKSVRNLIESVRRSTSASREAAR